jgi:superfamily II DNA or RNA helicase/HKD family nuclease
MKEGFYEKIVSDYIAKALENEKDKITLLESFSKNDGAVLIQRYFQQILQRAFNQINEERDEVAKQKLIDFTNELIKLTASYLNDEEFKEDQISNQGSVLKAFFHVSSFTQADLKKYIQESFPITGLSESALFNGSKHTPSLESELKKEMLTSDEVWWLVSFLKFEGVRLFEQVLRKMENEGKRVKIICTVYMGATDLKAIDFLSEFSNVEIKISFNTNQERLHAKSYLFIRNSGFHTAYIGSSNLSRSALTNGLEWNLKVTQQEIPHIISKCRNTFDTYWNDSNFELYSPEFHRDKLQLALDKGQNKKNDDEISKFFDLTPFPFQQQILDQLTQCRNRGDIRNLVVAATGTGKTVISAFDFKRYLKANPTANFLFVAHREEILRQARYTFRQVLKNPDFGELWFNGENPNGYNQLFVSIQTLNNRIKNLSLSPDFFDYIVIDEVHHSAASSYQRLLSYFKPKILLGLTATPERHDGENITKYFGHSLSAEIRLPDALNQKLLCPFQYFGINDETDISRVSWRRGRYEISELEKIYSEDNRRASEIIRNCRKYLTDYQEVRALGFCVSKKHAELMSNQFNQKGLKTAYLHAENSGDRKVIIQQFRRKEINYLFVVDIFNEGLDIPEIDTLLFLRPTESLTIFLQQLGRGLRLHEDKTCLTVLDFVGQQHVEYSFEHKFRAMLGKTHSKVKDELQQGFPNLPLGCSITLEETAKEIILKNIQSSYGSGERSLLKAMDRFTQDYNLEFTLKNFCELMGIELFAIYKTKQLFYELKLKHEGKSLIRISNAERLARVMANTWLATDSESYFKFLIDFVSQKSLDYTLLSTEQFLVMCYLDLFDSAPEVLNAKELALKLSLVFDQIEIREEVLSYLNYRLEQLEGIEKDIEIKIPCSLKLHGRYTRNQILAGLSESTLSHKSTSREGVYRIKDEDKETELLFVTLYKEDGKFNASTMYHDYFINEKLFHWQSQNSTSPESAVGQSYIKQIEINKDVLLFVRESSHDENNVTMAFVFCGKLKYVQHEGRKPMSITWKLDTPPPALLLNEGRKLGVG